MVVDMLSKPDQLREEERDGFAVVVDANGEVQACAPLTPGAIDLVGDSLYGAAWVSPDQSRPEPQFDPASLEAERAGVASAHLDLFVWRDPVARAKAARWLGRTRVGLLVRQGGKDPLAASDFDNECVAEAKDWMRRFGQSPNVSRTEHAKRATGLKGATAAGRRIRHGLRRLGKSHLWPERSDAGKARKRIPPTR